MTTGLGPVPETAPGQDISHPLLEACFRTQEHGLCSQSGEETDTQTMKCSVECWDKSELNCFKGAWETQRFSHSLLGPLVRTLTGEGV